MPPSPHPIAGRSILILSSHPHLGLPSGIFPSGFPTKTLYTPLLSLIPVTCPAYLIFIDLITRTVLGEKYRSLSSSLRSFSDPVTFSLLGPIFSSAPLSQTPSALNVSGQVSPPYKTTSSTNNYDLNYVKQVVGTVIIVTERNKQFIAIKRPVSTVSTTVFILCTSLYRSLQLSDTNISPFFYCSITTLI